jgi:hypothetical protein
VRFALTALGFFGACPKPTSTPVDGSFVLQMEESLAEVGELGEPIGPGRWQGPRGLSLVVSEGWMGETGPPGSSLLLSLRHRSTQIGFELWDFGHRDTITPRERADCTWVFQDESLYRTVPALVLTKSATCVAEEPGGPLVQAWFAVHGERELHIEVLYPRGQWINGRRVVEPLLLALQIAK